MDKNKEIFNLIKNQKIDELIKMIKINNIVDFNIRDENYNYFLHYIINYNMITLLEFILKIKELKLRFDIIDTDGRTILYNCIKYNYIILLKMLFLYNNNNIGISIIDIKDKLGLTALHYSVIFNNKEAFIYMIENGADPYIKSKDNNNAFILCLMYKRKECLDYLLSKKFKLNFTNSNGESLVHTGILYNDDNVEKLLDSNINLNSVSWDYGLSILHLSIIMDKYNIFEKLLDKKVDINLADFHGNTPLHYIFIEKRLEYLDKFFKQDSIQFNNSNINGDTPLHILLESCDIDINTINNKILEKMIIETDLNIQNNNGVSPFMKIINCHQNSNLLQKFKDILVVKPLNFFIEDNKSTKIKLTPEILEILVESYYNSLKGNKEELSVEWELYCSKDQYKQLKEIINDKNSKNTDEICKNKIKSVIINERRSIPISNKINFNFDNGIFTNYCFYTGMMIDILFGIILLNHEFKNIGLEVVLDYPLTINSDIENYYKKIGLDYPYKMDFSNIEIIWTYQKIFFPTYFDDRLTKILKNKETKYIVIPIGIETSIGSHANIIFWDVEKKTIERFEPNGSNYPMRMNYNPSLLDDILENKFKIFDEKITYYSPYKFLPTISFQTLENLETSKCKKIGDPNGFCGVWCIWWIYQRMINIKNFQKLPHNMIADELIRYIKFDNLSFKSIIRNFGKKITDIRDKFLGNHKIDINDWVVGNYDDELLNKLEKEIYNSIK